MTYITPAKYREIDGYFTSHLPYWKIPFRLCVRSGFREFETGLKRSKGKITSRSGKIYDMNTERVKPLAYYPSENGCAIEFRGKRGVKRIVPTVFSEPELEGWYAQTKPKTTRAFGDILKRRWGFGTHDGRRTFCINFFQIFGSTYEMQENLIALTGHKSIAQAEPYLREWRALRMANVFTDAVMEDIKKMMGHIKV